MKNKAQVAKEQAAQDAKAARAAKLNDQLENKVYATADEVIARLAASRAKAARRAFWFGPYRPLVRDMQRRMVKQAGSQVYMAFAQLACGKVSAAKYLFHCAYVLGSGVVRLESQTTDAWNASSYVTWLGDRRLPYNGKKQ